MLGSYPGQIDFGEGKATSEAAKVEESQTSHEHTKVRVRWMEAESRQRTVTVRGQIVANRKAEIRSDSDGRLVELPVERGDRVTAGQVIAKLSDDDLPARLARAKALLSQRAIELKAARRLKEKGYRAQTQVAAAYADYRSAEADVAAVEKAMRDKVILAPFDGIVSERLGELGDYLQQGDQFATVVELDPALAVGYVNEIFFNQLRTGMSGLIRPANGIEVQGKLRFFVTGSREKHTHLQGGV